MACLRLQGTYETKKSGFRVTIRIAMYNSNYTLKVGDFLPHQSNINPELKYKIESVSMSSVGCSDRELSNCFIIITNGVNRYKVPYKGAFEFSKNNEVQNHNEYYDAHKHFDLTVTKL